MSTTTLYEATPQTGTVSNTNLTSLYSNTTSFTTGVVNTAVYSVNGGTGVTVNPTTGNVVVSIGQDVATTASPTFNNLTLTGDLAVNGGDITTTGGITSINSYTLNSNTNIMTLPGGGKLGDTYNQGIKNVQIQPGPGAGGYAGINDYDQKQYVVADDSAVFIGTNWPGPSAKEWQFYQDGRTKFPSYTFPAADGTNNQILTTNGSGTLTWTSVSGLGLVNSVSGSGAGINVSPTTGAVVVTNTGVTSIIAGTNISVSSATGAVTVNATDTNTTYNIDATTTTGGANLNLNGSDSTTDSVKFASGTGITVSRTDANTITITNSDPGSTGVTSITGTTNQIIASSATGAVTLSTPQDIATTSNPVFAGVTGGNVTVGVSTDNTISTTTGDLNLTVAGAGNVIVNSLQRAQITRTTALTTGALNTLQIRADSSGTPTVGFGSNILYSVETAANVFKDAGFIGVQSTDVTTGAENFRLNFGLIQNGAAATNRLSLFSNGDINMFGGGKLTIPGLTSGYTALQAPATGSNLSYVLPGVAGTANTVLTNDGSGNLSWATPSFAGGSTFGNITVGVTTANTITTTTGDLVLDSTSGTIAVNVPTVSTDQTDITLFSTATNINLGGTGTATNVSRINIDSQATLDTATATTTSTATFILTSTSRNAMNVLINMIQGANVHCLNATLLKTSASTAMITTYGEMYNNIPLANFTANETGGGLQLLATPTSATSTDFSVVRTSLT